MIGDMKNDKRTRLEEDTRCYMACDPALATAEMVKVAMPEDMDYAHIVDGVLQITPDLEEEIAEVERGEVVTMGEFKTMFAKWLD